MQNTADPLMISLLSNNQKSSDEVEEEISKFSHLFLESRLLNMRLMKKKEKEDSESDTSDDDDDDIFTTPAIKENPYLYYGFGIKLYFDLIQTLILAMVVISVLLIPVLIIWNTGIYFEESSLNQFSLGNLGSSSVVCSSSFLDEDNFVDNWAIGKISSLTAVGVLPVGSGISDAWLGNQGKGGWDYYLDKNQFLADFNQNWYGKASCQMKGFKNKYIRAGSEDCNGNSAVGFYKFTWARTNKHNSVGAGASWCISLINLLCGVIFLVVLRNFRYKTGKEFEEYDQDTVTVSDYAVEFNITDSMYNTFKNKFERKLRRDEIRGSLSNYSLAYEFKIALIKKIEKQISKIPAISKEINDSSIWYFYLSFNNKEAIDLLEERGKLLIKGDIIKAKEIESKVEALKEKLYLEMGIPDTAFIAFEEEEACQRALSSEGRKITFWDELLYFKEAPEPSDVIWEYNDQSVSEFWRKSAIAISLVWLLVFLNFVIVFVIKSLLTHDYGNINWDFIDAIYKSKDALFKSAIDEFNAYSKHGNRSALKGTLKWFWDQEWSNIKNGHSSYRSSGTQSIEDIWYGYFIDSYLSYLILNSLGILIIIVNVIMKQAILAIVTWVGFRTQSQLSKSLTIASFATRFVNTAIILLVRKSSISGYSFPYFGAFIDSIYYDFDPDWYREIGSSIVIANLFNSISPVVDFCVDYSTKNLFRIIDKRTISWDKYTTNCKTIQQYVNLYGGSEYKFYYMYSYIISMTWITFMFGSGLPILYPIYLFSLLVLWGTDRMLLAYYYYYKQPPMFDDKLSNSSVDLCRYAILLQMFFGYNMLNNNQIFNAGGESKESSLLSSNFLANIRFNHALPFLVCFILFIIFAIGEYIFVKAIRLRRLKWGFESLPPFQRCLKESDVEWIFTEEKYLREKENFKILSDKFYRTLRSLYSAGKQPEMENERKIQQIATYDILANPIYQEKFQYYSVLERGDGPDPIFMSNKVRKMLYLPYLSKDQLSRFKFADVAFNEMSRK